MCQELVTVWGLGIHLFSWTPGPQAAVSIPPFFHLSELASLILQGQNQLISLPLSLEASEKPLSKERLKNNIHNDGEGVMTQILFKTGSEMK
jgi:hypothetical protein